MTRVAALPFADRLWVQHTTHPPVALPCTRVETRRMTLFWCRLDERAGALEPGYYLVRRHDPEGWLYRVDPRHPVRRMEWHRQDPELIGEVGVADTEADADDGYRAQQSARRQLGLDDGSDA